MEKVMKGLESLINYLVILIRRYLNWSSCNNPDILLKNTDCDTLDEIRVISLRNQEITQTLKVLSKCENLTVLYLQNNIINVKDLNHLQHFANLKKIDLSDN